ncbi:hypothetical protein EDD17DRAFT_830493 [Pisolithus thermaeus]|nr:hypothetical protein EDD17DRAFT_830493 [Pisolithus thermaeus]
MGLNYQSTGREFESEANYMYATCLYVIEKVYFDLSALSTCSPVETDTLKRLVITRRLTIRSWILVAAFILGLPILFETSAHLRNQCPLSPEARDRMRGEWQKEVLVQENLRHEWQREEEERRHKREEWQREVEEREHLERERRDQEKRERQKMDMFWDQVKVHHCTTYGTREYTAYLANLPIDYPQRVEACKETQLEIHGKSYFPKHCEDQGPGAVMGRWEINHNEPDCVPFWSWFKNKGCTSEGSGKRRFEHYLEHLPNGGDWREFCATTPVSFHGMHFPGAETCFQYNHGIYGQWEVEDSSC